MEGHNFTRFRSLGTDREVEKNIDKIMANRVWLSLFQDVNVHCLSATMSDHYHVFLRCDKITTPNRTKLGFCFENASLTEEDFNDFVCEQLNSLASLPLLDKMKQNGEILQNWGKSNCHKIRKENDKLHGNIEQTRNNVGHDNGNYFTALKRCMNSLLMKPSSRERVLQAISSSISEDDNRMLTAPFIIEELAEAIFSM
ncbi:uncharacterized protein LOC131648539 [Vicia villosa]|uniref:uncharacterized protein LOC131648539 n=1 Tax=Vicia villosa TaxID=3911 RepID=UPI00273BCA33|nr:uncharacterized protein LOC131648539 [Vicia villosa]